MTYNQKEPIVLRTTQVAAGRGLGGNHLLAPKEQLDTFSSYARDPKYLPGTVQGFYARNEYK